jgi:hypothetical protein
MDFLDDRDQVIEDEDAEAYAEERETEQAESHRDVVNDVY